jgi:hypothetical protein
MILTNIIFLASSEQALSTSSPTPSSAPSSATSSTSQSTPSSSSSDETSLTSSLLVNITASSPSQTQSSSTSPEPATTSSSTSKKSNAWVAGAVIGPVFGVLILCLALWVYRLRRRRSYEHQSQAAVDGRKGNVLPEDIEKENPELPGHSPILPTMPSSRTEVEANRASHVPELGMGAAIYNPAELEGYQVPYRQYEQSTRNIQSQEPTELYTGTPQPHNAVISATGQESAQELERLAQEEQRLDAEIAEAERIRELRNQRASVQERLARARQGL